MIKLAEHNFEEEPIVVAHRGSSGTAPENTMVAIRRGVEAGAQMVEIDVQPTADGRVIVFHDHVLGRTTNGSGYVAAATWEEISCLDAGGWMSQEFTGERVPLLDGVLDYLRGRAYLNIELKRHQNQGDDGTKFLGGVLASIRSSEMAEHTLLSSFDHELLATSVRLAPEIPCAVIMHPDDRGLPSERALPVGARGVVMSLRQLSHERIRDAREHALPVGVYTLNTPEEAMRARRYGASVLVTNFPEVVIAALTEAGPVAG